MLEKNLLTNSYFYSKLVHVISKVMYIYFGVWLSLVEHYFREVGAASSNLVTPIKKSFYKKGFFIIIIITFQNRPEFLQDGFFFTLTCLKLKRSYQIF